MKKVIISLALLGMVSAGAMAFIGNTYDDPPANRTSHYSGQDNDDVYRDYGYRHHRRGGCCGRYDSRDSQRRYECCDIQYDCRACHNDRCTVDNCHHNGTLCDECAQWRDSRHRHRSYHHR